VNPRKEFFRVSLDEIDEVVRKHHGEFKSSHHGEFKSSKMAEAIECRKTMALLASQTENVSGIGVSP
jgi:hypothetical protein